MILVRIALAAAAAAAALAALLGATADRLPDNPGTCVTVPAGGSGQIQVGVCK